MKIKVSKKQAGERVKKILPVLKKAYPNAHCTLDYSTPLELLIATIMAAQCTDKRVNIVTKDVFKKYKSAAEWAAVDVKQIEADIKSTGFYRNKSKNIKETARMVADEFGGEVPATMDELLTLPGVGRKTANVLLGNVFETQGVVCDTHVIRLSRRLQLSANSDPVKLELDLMEIVPKKEWTIFSHLLVFHGRAVCLGRKPKCEGCVVSDHCPSANRAELW